MHRVKPILIWYFVYCGNCTEIRFYYPYVLKNVLRILSFDTFVTVFLKIKYYVYKCNRLLCASTANIQ